jgi:hypothetical protein
MDWLYVWSPRYRFFHELLQATTKDLSGFTIQPVFAEQHLFKPVQTSSSHFLAGIPIKIHVIKTYIERNMGTFFFFTDVDLIILPEFQQLDLESYKINDITAMAECHETIKYNIGCLLIHCSPKTLVFFERVLQRIRTDHLLDQDAFHLEAEVFDGKIGVFDKTQFLQSNMLSDTSDSYKIIQCLTSESDPTEILLEKVLTIMSVFDVSALRQYLPEDVQKLLES